MLLKRQSTRALTIGWSARDTHNRAIQNKNTFEEESGNEKLNEVEEGYVSYRDGSRSSYHLHTCISSSVQFHRYSESSWNSSYRRLIITLQN